MHRKVRLKDVAERAGVAVNTASTILNQRPNSWASKETEARVFEAAKELGYRPSRTARALQSGRYNSICLLIPDLTNPFFATLADELEVAVEERGYSLLVENSRTSLVREKRLFAELADMEVDGAITYLSDSGVFLDQLEERFRKGIPIVALDHGTPDQTLPVDNVTSDFTEGLEQAISAMLDLGHRRFAFLAALAEGQADGHRPRLFQEVLASRGIPADDVQILRCDHSMNGACETVASFLKNSRRPLPTALFAMNDLSAIGGMRAALEAGLDVPRDLSVVGVDDIPLASFMPISLSSIRQRYRKIAGAAAEMLISRIEGTLPNPETPRQVILPTHFIARESCGPAPADA